MKFFSVAAALIFSLFLSSAVVGAQIYPGHGGNSSYPTHPGNGGTTPVYPGTPTYPTPPTPPTTQPETGGPGSISAYTLYCYGHARYAAGNFNSAVIYFNELLKRWPNSQYADDAAFWQAQIRWEQKNHLEAIRLFSLFLHSWPHSEHTAMALFGLGQAEKDYGRINFANRQHLFNAVSHFTGYQQRFPHDRNAAEALFQAGECYEISGDYGSAKSYYSRVTDLYPYSAAAMKAREKLSGRY